jgi:hypothetical protein
MTERKPLRVETGAGDSAGWEFAHSVLFTGHMIDAADREEPRFAPRAEGAARTAIRASVQQLRDWGGTPMVGVAGGASGGDLLFHEVCAELGVATRLRLALPVEEFIATSVAPAGEGWVQRFRMLVKQLGPENVRVMGENDGRKYEATEDVGRVCGCACPAANPACAVGRPGRRRSGRHRTPGQRSAELRDSRGSADYDTVTISIGRQPPRDQAQRCDGPDCFGNCPVR